MEMLFREMISKLFSPRKRSKIIQKYNSLHIKYYSPFRVF